MRRFVATFFRHPFTLTLPAILIPIIVVFAVRMLASSYTSQATIFITTNPYVSVSPANYNPYISPAQNLSNNISEYLVRASFLLSVADHTDMPKTYKPGTANIGGLMEQRITSGLTILPAGNETLYIQYSDKDPHIAAQVITALLQQYLTFAIRDAEATAQTTVAFYQQQLQTDEQRLATDDQALRNYTQAHPFADITTDAELALLEANYKQDLDQTQKDQQQLQQVSSTKGILASLYTFEVTDPPTIPTAPTVKSKTILIAMIGGVALGLGTSLGLIGLLTVADRRIYSRDDLVEEIPMPVLEVIPSLRGLQEETPIIGSEEALAHLAQLPVLATLPRFIESGETQAANRTLTITVEDE